MLKKTKTLAVVTGLFLSSQVSFATKGELFGAQTAQGVTTGLSDGTDVNVADEDGTTALYIAAKDGETEVVWALLLSGANPMASKKHLITPWMRSVSSSIKNHWKRTEAVIGNFSVQERKKLRKKHHNTQECMRILTAWTFMSKAKKSKKRAELGLSPMLNS